MLEALEILSVRQGLQNEGIAAFLDPQGRLVTIASTQALGIDGPTRMMIAYEGKGCGVFDGDRPLNKFRLVSAGFSGDVAGVLAETINFIVTGERAGSEQAKALIPKGD
jgi:hypothetical protein